MVSGQKKPPNYDIVVDKDDDAAVAASKNDKDSEDGDSGESEQQTEEVAKP